PGHPAPPYSSARPAGRPHLPIAARRPAPRPCSSPHLRPPRPPSPARPPLLARAPSGSDAQVSHVHPHSPCATALAVAPVASWLVAWPPPARELTPAFMALSNASDPLGPIGVLSPVDV